MTTAVEQRKQRGESVVRQAVRVQMRKEAQCATPRRGFHALYGEGAAEAGGEGTVAARCADSGARRGAPRDMRSIMPAAHARYEVAYAPPCFDMPT